jgi:hypothetical protein
MVGSNGTIVGGEAMITVYGKYYWEGEYVSNDGML